MIFPSWTQDDVQDYLRHICKEDQNNDDVLDLIEINRVAERRQKRKNG